MTRNPQPSARWATVGKRCAFLALFVTLAFVVIVFTQRTNWHSWGVLGLIALFNYFVLLVFLLGLLGTLFSITGAVRHEPRSAVVTAAALNLGIIGCNAAFLYFTYLSPLARMKEEGARQRAHYLATRTPEQHLFDAIRQNQFEDVRRLLKYGVDSNTQIEGTRALHHAATHGSPEIVACLLEYGATDDPEKPIALHLAATFGDLQMLKLLVAHGWNPTLQLDYFQNGTRVTPLNRAISASKTGRNKDAEIEYLLHLTENTKTDAEQESEPDF